VAREEAVEVEGRPLEVRVRLRADEVERELPVPATDHDELAGDPDELRVVRDDLGPLRDANLVVLDGRVPLVRQPLGGRATRERHAPVRQENTRSISRRRASSWSSSVTVSRERVHHLERSIDDGEYACPHVRPTDGSTGYNRFVSCPPSGCPARRQVVQRATTAAPNRNRFT